MSDQVAIKTWGNSQGIRIPKNILEKLGLHVSDTLQIEVIDDSIVLKKAFKHKTFEERVAEYNGEISICDYDWGEPVGMLVVSKNEFIKKTGVFHVCPLLENYAEGPLHIKVRGVKDTSGTAICEQLKLIDPSARSCKRIDRVPYHMIMNVSDAIQGIFEYD